MMMVTVFGCNRGTDSPDPGEVTNPGDNTDDPGGDENPVITDLALDAPITQVPVNAVSRIDRAVIHQGNLWLGTTDGRMWKQTNTGNVSRVLWAPDGHAVAYFQNEIIHSSSQSLFYLVPGNSPVHIDDNIFVQKSWFNDDGFVWSPDSTGLAYGKYNEEAFNITWVDDMTKDSFLIAGPVYQGPYWLSQDRIIFSSGADRPSTIIINSARDEASMGDEIITIPDTFSPYPTSEGLIAATGLYDPEGVMEDFYYTGLAYMGLDGTNAVQVYDQSTYFSYIFLHPNELSRTDGIRYLAISDSQNLSLLKYVGLTNKSYPTKVPLLSQDTFLTFSEFLYPLWFTWSPNGNNLVAMIFKFTQEGDYGEQEGYWDLIMVDRDANQEILLNEIYTISGHENPVPFSATLPLNWSPCGNYVNYLVERNNDAYDLWRINIVSKATELVLENSSLPEYRR